MNTNTPKTAADILNAVAYTAAQTVAPQNNPQYEQMSVSDALQALHAELVKRLPEELYNSTYKPGKKQDQAQYLLLQWESGYNQALDEVQEIVSEFFGQPEGEG